MNNFYEGKKVLVTGGAGLAGHTFIKELIDRGANVFATTFKRRKIDLDEYYFSRITQRKVDLMNYDDCLTVTKGMNIVIHCAVHIRGAGGQVSNPIALIRNNTIPSLNIMDAAVANKVSRFGVIGSSTMYPDSSDEMQEHLGFIDKPPEVYTGVGYFKRYIEQMAMYYHKITDTDFAIARTTAIYGPHDNFFEGEGHVIPSLLIKANRGDDPFEIWGDGTQVRNFVYVDDLVDGLLLMVEKHCVADPINITSKEKTTIRTLVKTIVKNYNYTPELKYDITKPIMIHTRLVSIAKAMRVLDWHPKVSLEEGIKLTVDWCNDNKETNNNMSKGEYA